MTTFHSKPGQVQNLLIGVGVFFSTLILYLVTSYPTVAYIDSGELALANGTLGIAHPTGYPLYTILGRVFALLPLELIKTQILLGALCTSTAVALLALTLIGLLKPPTLLGRVTVALACALFGVAPLIWSQGVTNEVYSLHLLMLVLIVSLLLRPYSHRYLIIGAFVVGMSFGNHMSTILLVPTVGYYLLVNRRKIMAAPKVLLVAFGFGIVAATLYLYLPIRSAQDPIFNWGHPTNWANFVRHVSGWQYQVWMFTRSSAEIFKTLGNFAVILFGQFPVPYWLIILYGIAATWKKHHETAMVLTSIIIFNLLYSLNFNIPDIDNYLLPSLLALFVFSVIGMVSLITARKRTDSIAAAVIAVLVAWGLAANWQAQDESGNTAALDGVHNLYASTAGEALVFSSQWDIVSPWLYSHFALGEHPEVIIVDPELARRSWYPDMIRHVDNQLYESVKNDIAAFLPHVRLFEANERYDRRGIEMTYQAMLLKMMEYPARKFYYEQSVQPAIQPEWKVAINGQLYRVIREGEQLDSLIIPTAPPQFGKPADALNVRENLRLEQYHLMKALGETKP